MILVAGGSGRLGTLLVKRLQARGLAVRVLTRDRKRAAHLEGHRVEVIEGDVRDRGSVQAAMVDVHIVVSAVHGFGDIGNVSPASVDRDGNRQLIDAAAAANAAVVLMSIVGASADHPIELFRMKHLAEECLRASGAPWTIVRATAFAEFWLDLLSQTTGTSGRPVIFGRGMNPINFVSVSDVAALAEQAIVDPSVRGEILEIGGIASSDHSPSQRRPGFHPIGQKRLRRDHRLGRPMPSQLGYAQSHAAPTATRLRRANLEKTQPHAPQWRCPPPYTPSYSAPIETKRRRDGSAAASNRVAG